MYQFAVKRKLSPNLYLPLLDILYVETKLEMVVCEVNRTAVSISAWLSSRWERKPKKFPYLLPFWERSENRRTSFPSQNHTSDIKHHLPAHPNHQTSLTTINLHQPTQTLRNGTPLLPTLQEAPLQKAQVEVPSLLARESSRPPAFRQDNPIPLCSLELL